MENTKPLLSVRDLKVYFDLDEGTVKSVDGISFDAYEGKGRIRVRKIRDIHVCYETDPSAAGKNCRR